MKTPSSKTEWVVLLSSFLIFALGLLMIFSTTSAEVLDHALDKSTHQAVFRQFYYAGAGMLLAYSAYQMGFDKLLKWSPFLLAVFTFLLLLVLIPGVGREVNGSKRWLNLLGFSFQPSEFVKYLVPAYFIHRYLPLQGTHLSWKEFLEILGKALVPMLLILVEPNNGTTAVIIASLLALCLLMQVPIKFWALPVGAFMIAGVLFASQLPYIKARFNVYLHPELDLKGRGHQPHQAKIAAGSGGLFGRGPGNSLQKMSYLPEAQNDYIAAIYAEEFGYIGIVSLICFYLLFLIAGFSIAFHANSKEGFYYGSSIVFLMTLQAFLNLGVVSGLLPSTGLNLPLFSQGGSSLMAHMTAIGLLLSISKSRKIYA